MLTNRVVSLCPKYILSIKGDFQSVPLKSMSILGINYCTASLGLEIAAKMAPGEVVTVTGAAGGTGLAATELSLSRHHPVGTREERKRQTVCVVRGDRQRSFLEELLSREYPEGRFTVVDSEATPLFKEEIKAKYVGVERGSETKGGSDVVFDTVGTAAVFNENLLRSVRFGSHILETRRRELNDRIGGGGFFGREHPEHSGEPPAGEERECDGHLLGRVLEEPAAGGAAGGGGERR